MSTLKVDTLRDTSGNIIPIAKAWIDFNGQGTISIRDDSNVSSISDNGTGDTTITFSTALSTANFMYSHGGRRAVNNFNESAPNVGLYGSGAYSTTSNRYLTYDNNADGRQDCEHVGLSWLHN